MSSQRLTHTSGIGKRLKSATIKKFEAERLNAHWLKYLLKPAKSIFSENILKFFKKNKYSFSDLLNFFNASREKQILFFYKKKKIPQNKSCLCWYMI